MNGFKFAAARRLLLVLAMCAVPVMAEEPAKPAHSVLLCGSGASPYYDTLISSLSDTLHARHVTVKMAATSDLPFSTCMTKTAQLEATSLIYLVVDVANLERVVVSAKCVTDRGENLWNENAEGQWTSDSLDEILSQATRQLIEKIEAHVGERGLETE